MTKNGFRPMNRFHQRYCRSEKWTRRVEDGILPWVLDGLTPGPEVLEIGPGFGVTTRVLARTIKHVTALELDDRLAAGLADRVDPEATGRVSVVNGDGTGMPFPDGDFDGALCFTMLHHIPSTALQDRLFREVARVVRPGGLFAGCDSRPSLRFRAIHLGDTMTVVDPETLGARLEAAGFTDVEVATLPAILRWRARTPSRV